MDKISSSMQKVSMIMNKVTSNISEQMAGVEQINSVIIGIEEITQENHNFTERLSETVFKLESDTKDSKEEFRKYIAMSD